MLHSSSHMIIPTTRWCMRCGHEDMRLPHILLLINQINRTGRMHRKKHWIDEAFGQRTILANLSDIPISEIVGYRSPFLQTAGDATFEVLQENGFKYDCSMPTRGCSKPHPSYPYNWREDSNRTAKSSHVLRRNIPISGFSL
jgi:hypothetical protein